MSMEHTSKSNDTLVSNCLLLIREYAWLLDAFVLDFYTNNHWERLPLPWREVLCKVKLEELGHWMMRTNRTNLRVWPLSLIALRAAVVAYSLPREISQFPIPDCSNDECHSPVKDIKQGEHISISLLSGNAVTKPGDQTECLKHPNLKNLFLKHVKPKKRHETSIMARLCAKASKEANCLYVVDVGAGKGHLSRLMAYGYGLKVCGVEAQVDLIIAARKLDIELEMTASKHIGTTYVSDLPRPVHLETTLNCDVNSFNEFFMKLRLTFGVSADEDFAFGIVGLHPCGDLAATLLRLFASYEEAKFICIASCCYMKLNLEKESMLGILILNIRAKTHVFMNTLLSLEIFKSDKLNGYPLSAHFQSLPPQLVCQTYEALEVSCHALETYCARLQQKQYSMLKIHCYRAALEKNILKYWPERKRLGLRSVKHYDQLSFVEYAKIALSRVNLEVPLDDLTNEETEKYLQRWQQVVVMYSLRLLLAPLVETAILLDRLYFLREHGADCCINPGFDPRLSPRNLIITGWKKVLASHK